MPLPSEKLTVSKIIEAATEIFAQKGYAGARVAAIAEKAGVNKATIYYHIGGKDALYARVLHDVIGQTAEGLVRRLTPAMSPVDKLRTYIRAVLESKSRNALVPLILQQEIAAGGTNLPEVVARDFVRMFHILGEILAEGAAQGQFRKTSPVLAHFLIAGPMILLARIDGIAARFPELAETLARINTPSRNMDAEIEILVVNAVRSNPTIDIETTPPSVP